MSSAEQTVSRKDLVLPRFLAVTLFGLAAIMGLPTAAAAVGCLFAGNWRTVLLMATIWPIVIVAIWLGRLLWYGCPIPTWFIFVFAAFISAVPAVGLAWRGTWMGALALLALSTPFLIMLLPILGERRGQPSKPKAFDDELA